ncbi:MAG: metallophosphoesterase, partial [Alphaproteobacteria bacterium]
MKIIHITDMHFGPYQWAGNNALLLERLNEFEADLVFNTGDMTTDSLEDEFQQAGDFLSKINCANIVSILGNHDKFSRRSHDFF